MVDDRPETKTTNKLGASESFLARQSAGLSSSVAPFFDMYRGYFPLWRKIVDWGWYKDSNTKSVFLHLLLTANHKEKDFLGHKIAEGQCVHGLIELSKNLGLSVQATRTAIKHLKSTNEITIHSTNRFTIYTLNNYFKYLPKNNPDNTLATKQLTNEQQTTNKQLTTSNNDKNIRIKEERVPSSLAIVIDYFKELRYPKEEALKYYDYFTSNGWKVGGKAPMKDWKAAARNWVRKLPPEVKLKEEPQKIERPVYTAQEELMAEKARQELKSKLGIKIPK